MKRLLASTFFLLTLSLSCAFAIDKALDIKPEAANAPTSVEWENKNDAALAAATTDEALAHIVSAPAPARGLLLKVRNAYETDPLAACQVAAVTQWVMLDDPWYCFLWWDGEHEAGRKIWVDALLLRAEGTTDSYIKTFCLDQLRWCGCDCSRVLERIRAIGESSGDKAVKDFSEVVLRELQGQSIGL